MAHSNAVSMSEVDPDFWDIMSRVPFITVGSEFLVSSLHVVVDVVQDRREKKCFSYAVTSTASWVKNFLNDKYGKVNNVFSRPSSRARLSTKCFIGIFLPNPHTRSIYPHFTNRKIELPRGEGVELIRGEWYVSKGSFTSALVMVTVEWKGNVLNHIKWSGSQSLSSLKATGLAVTAQGKTEIKPKSLVDFQTMAVHWWLASVGSNKLKIESERKIS